MYMDCSICYENININYICITSCDHIFCKKCLDKWFNKNKYTCPICRNNITYFKYNNQINHIYLLKLSDNQISQYINEINNTLTCFKFLSFFLFLLLINDTKKDIEIQNC